MGQREESRIGPRNPRTTRKKEQSENMVFRESPSGCMSKAGFSQSVRLFGPGTILWKLRRFGGDGDAVAGLSPAGLRESQQDRPEARRYSDHGRVLFQVSA
jgi:hypothetical protein